MPKKKTVEEKVDEVLSKPVSFCPHRNLAETEQGLKCNDCGEKI